MPGDSPVTVLGISINIPSQVIIRVLIRFPLLSWIVEVEGLESFCNRICISKDFINTEVVVLQLSIDIYLFESTIEGPFVSG